MNRLSIRAARLALAVFSFGVSTQTVHATRVTGEQAQHYVRQQFGEVTRSLAVADGLRRFARAWSDRRSAFNSSHDLAKFEGAEAVALRRAFTATMLHQGIPKALIQSALDVVEHEALGATLFARVEGFDPDQLRAVILKDNYEVLPTLLQGSQPHLGELAVKLDD